MNSNRALFARGRRFAAVLLAFVPAIVAGAQIAALVFFLNPQLALAPSTALRATLYYSALFAPLSLALHLAVVRWRPIAIERLAPWSLTLVIALAALGFAVHASIDAYLLPEAINGQLIKSALWLGFGAVLLFYSALLHTLHHRRYGLRSRLLVALVVIGAICVPFERRASYRPAAASAAPLAFALDPLGPQLVVVAMPTATLDAILPLARQGKLPFFAQLLDEGATARLVSVSPPRRTALWTSWATGKYPFRHGIAGAARFRGGLYDRKVRLGLLPILPAFWRWGLAGAERVRLVSGDREALTVWEIFERLGRSAEAPGFPAWLGGDGEPARPAAGRGRSPAARELRAAGFERFVREYESDRARLNAATLRLRRPAGAPRALFVELPGLERPALSSYGAFAAVNFEGARAGALTDVSRALETLLGGLDSELAQFAAQLPAGTLFAVSSPYGVVAPRSLRRIARLLRSSDLELRGTLGAGADGLLLLRGRGVRAGVRIAEARLEDLVPTLLYAAGLPIARDFDGRVLAEIFEPAVLQERALSFVPTFESLPLRR